MTCSVYIFGNMSNGYTQFPSDYTVGMLQEFKSLSSAPSQVIIHRDNNLMYYGYIRGLDNSLGYIGFCVLINGMMLTHISQLFNTFEDIVTEMAAKGEIISLNEKGDVIPVVASLDEKQNEIESIASNIQNYVTRMLEDAVKLPPVSYDISSTDKKYFSILDANNEIVEATGKYGYTYISKDENPDSPQLLGYRSVVKKLHSEKVSLAKEYDDLKAKYNHLNEQKKQYTKVAILGVIVVIAILGLFKLKGVLENTRGNLESAHSEILQNENTIRTQDNKISSLRNSLLLEKEKREKTEEELNELKSIVNENYPIIITNVEVANVDGIGNFETDFGETIYSDHTMYLKPRITYTGFNLNTDEGDDAENLELTLRVRLYTPDGLFRNSSSPFDCSWTEEINVDNGENTHIGRGFGSSSRGVWESGAYRYEFWYGNVCLKAYSFTIY